MVAHSTAPETPPGTAVRIACPPLAGAAAMVVGAAPFSPGMLAVRLTAAHGTWRAGATVQVWPHNLEVTA